MATRTDSFDRDDLIVYTLLVVIGAIPVAITLGEAAVFGWDATVGLLMVGGGLLGLVIEVIRGLRHRHATGGGSRKR